MLSRAWTPNLLHTPSIGSNILVGRMHKSKIETASTGYGPSLGHLLHKLRPDFIKLITGLSGFHMGNQLLADRPVESCSATHNTTYTVCFFNGSSHGEAPGNYAAGVRLITFVTNLKFAITHVLLLHVTPKEGPRRRLSHRQRQLLVPQLCAGCGGVPRVLSILALLGITCLTAVNGSYCSLEAVKFELVLVWWGEV